jgi:hypothetical protein
VGLKRRLQLFPRKQTRGKNNIMLNLKTILYKQVQGNLAKIFTEQNTENNMNCKELKRINSILG